MSWPYPPTRKMFNEEDWRFILAWPDRHQEALEYYRRDLNPGPREHDPFPEKEES